MSIKEHHESATIIRLNASAYAYVGEDADPKEVLAHLKKEHKKTVGNQRDLEEYDNIFLWFIDEIPWYY